MTAPDRFEAANKDDASRAALATNIEKELRSVRPRNFVVFRSGVEGVAVETTAIEDAATKFKDATAPEERKKAFEELNQATINLEKTEHFDQLRRKTAVELRVNSAQEYASQLVGNGRTGWSKFRLELRDGVRKP